MKGGQLAHRTAKWIAASELAILLLASPLFLFSRPSLAPALLLLPLLWLARRHSRGHFIPRTPVDWSILGLLTMTLISVWATPDLPFSFRKIAGLLYGVAVFYATVDWGQRQSSVLRVALAIVGLGCGSALLGLLGTQWLAKLPAIQAIISYLPQTLRGMPGAESGFNPNQVAGALIIFLPLQVALFGGLISDAGSFKIGRIWLLLGMGASLLLVGAVVFLAQSRIAWAALTLGLFGMGAVAMRRVRLILVALIVCGLAILIALGPVGVSEWLVRQGWLVGSGKMSWAGRVEHWSRGLWAVAEFPLTGTGMNMFRRMVWQRYTLFIAQRGTVIGHAHNAFLQVALDLGLPGLICYLALLGSVLVIGWQCYKKSFPLVIRMTALGSIVGLVVHAIWGIADAVALGAKQGFLWWAMLGLVVVAALQDEKALAK